ncbi:MAG: corrinoid protein [Candidatus Bathyarchaeia archaeon]|nr:corrinoid protein [Candidatus Bathyarchaeota archaeon]
MSIKSNLEDLASLVIEGDPDAVKSTVKKLLKTGMDPLHIVEGGLTKGIRIIGEKYGRGEIFLTELLMAAEAMKAGMSLIYPELQKHRKELTKIGSVVIGTVAGDIHDLGKNIVAALFSAHGFEVTDLGVDVPDRLFIEKVKELKPDILGLSALMTSTIPKQREIINLLKEEGLRKKVKVMVGGAAVNEDFAREIGADGYAENANDAVERAKILIVEKSVKTFPH